MTYRRLRGSVASRALAVAAVAALIGCMPHGGGGGGGSTNSNGDPVYVGATTSISGVVRYVRVPADGSGLRYGLQFPSPARGVVVEVRDQADVLVSRGNTDASGAYSLSAAQNQINHVIVLAELGPPRAPEFAVVDNRTNGADTGDATYGKIPWGAGPTDVVVAGTAVANADITLASGISAGGAYSTSRPSAPFAILDVIYTERELVRSTDPTIVFPRLAVEWSPAQSGVGDYDPRTGRIRLNGVVGVNTDEFDTHVIAHEWGHYFVNNFSRDDTIGGTHYYGDILDDSVAFSEGFATGLSGIATSYLPGVEILGQLYVDTGWTSGTPAVFAFNIETPTADLDTGTMWPGDGSRTNAGYWNETAIADLVYDLWDDTPAEAGDPVALGFGPICRVMRSTQRRTPYFTSVVTFLAGIVSAVPDQAAAVRTEAQRWDIAPNGATFGEFELETLAATHHMRRYTHLQPSGLDYTRNMDGDALEISDQYQVDDTFANKLFARQYFVVENLASGTYRITATPNDPLLSGLMEIRQPGVLDPYYANVPSPPILQFTTNGGEFVFSVGLIPGYGPQRIPFKIKVELVPPPSGPG